MFRHGSGNSDCLNRRATLSERFLGFQEDFYARLSVFIITLCSCIGLRRNWCRWKAKKKCYNLNIWTANRNLCPDNHPDGMRVQKFHNSFSYAERIDSEDCSEAQPSRPDVVLFWEDRTILERRKTVRRRLSFVRTLHSQSPNLSRIRFFEAYK
jgi:hypothetical protein